VSAPLKAPLFLLGLAASLALLIVITNVGQRPPAAADTSAAAVAPEADAAVGQLVLARCGSCHGLDTLSHNPQDAAGWSKTVDSMMALGAQVQPSEKPALVEYLAKHFGPSGAGR
jgi:cytochrome c553